jgi:hypothetical protein
VLIIRYVEKCGVARRATDICGAENMGFTCRLTTARIMTPILLLLLLLLFQALNFIVETFGLLNDLFPFPSILYAGYPVLDLHLADVLFVVILPSVLGSSL